jgi:hypothetical protein
VVLVFTAVVTAADDTVARVASPLRPRPLERAQAWLVTGPLGHLWSVTADVVLMWTRYALARLRRD